MIGLPLSVRIFLAPEPTDLRRGFDRLAGMVRRAGGDPFSGHLFAFVSGDWTLTFTADDGNRLYLDGELVSDAWYDHGMTPVATTATLPAGWHPITLEMYEQGGAGGATFEWEGPGTPRALVPGDHLGAVRLDAAGPPTATVTAVQTTGTSALVTVSASEVSALSLKLTAEGQLAIPLPESSPTTSYRWEGQVPKGAWTLEVTLTDAGGKTAVVSTPLTMP